MKFVYLRKCLLLNQLRFEIRFKKSFENLEICEFPLKFRQFPNGLYIFKNGEMRMSRIYYAIIEGVCYKVLNYDLSYFIHFGYRRASVSLCNLDDCLLSENGLKLKNFALKIYDRYEIDRLKEGASFAQRLAAFKMRKRVKPQV